MLLRIVLGIFKYFREQLQFLYSINNFEKSFIYLKFKMRLGIFQLKKIYFKIIWQL